ncbi:unnamed protein product [Lactuca saligna]|uniref:Uncharacterized protein n=1 Tax=Lactuca saligna TaxID=75948 RepID=A0AA35VE08_LACSI|nr:unnamed protein product [Lactuca saligna]
MMVMMVMMIFGDDGDDDDDDDLGGFTYSLFHIRTKSEDEAIVSKGQFKAIHEKLDQLQLASKASSSKAYLKEIVESLFEHITKVHAANAAKMNVAVSETADVCKSTTEKVDKLITKTTTFMESYRTTYNNKTASANEALRNLGAMFKTEKINLTEKVKVLDLELQQSEKQVKDLLSERVVVRSCIMDVTGLLSDIIETMDSMISITVRKDLAKKLSPVFTMLYRLQGVSPQLSDPKQGGEGGSNVEPPKVPIKSIINKEPKGKENLIEDEPIIDDDEDEELVDAELKSRKARDVELNETQRIVKEAEEKRKGR